MTWLETLCTLKCGCVAMSYSYAGCVQSALEAHAIDCWLTISAHPPLLAWPAMNAHKFIYCGAKNKSTETTRATVWYGLLHMYVYIYYYIYMYVIYRSICDINTADKITRYANKHKGVCVWLGAAIILYDYVKLFWCDGRIVARFKLRGKSLSSLYIQNDTGFLYLAASLLSLQ